MNIPRCYRYALLQERMHQIEGELFTLEDESNDRGELKVLEGAMRAAADLAARLALLAESTEPKEFEVQAREGLARIAERGPQRIFTFSRRRNPDERSS